MLESYREGMGHVNRSFNEKHRYSTHKEHCPLGFWRTVWTPGVVDWLDSYQYTMEYAAAEKQR
jgi:hypothetical protein